MILRHNKRTVPQLNTTSTADISFILLVFFLIMTSMDTDKGLQRQLPPMDSKAQEEVTDVTRSNLLSISLDAASRLTIDGKKAEVSSLRRRVTDFVGRSSHPARLVIDLDVDRRASYDSYFNVQNEIVAAYNTLRDRCSLKLFGKEYARCTPEQREQVRRLYPQRITESYDGGEEGGAI